jgi:hypothetical protein
MMCALPISFESVLVVKIGEFIIMTDIIVALQYIVHSSKEEKLATEAKAARRVAPAKLHRETTSGAQKVPLKEVKKTESRKFSELLCVCDAHKSHVSGQPCMHCLQAWGRKGIHASF